MTVVLDGVEELTDFYANVRDDFGLIDYGDYLNGEHKLIEKLHARYFESATGPDGVPWPPLAPSTIGRKGHNRILIDKDRLRKSLASETADSIRETITDGPQPSLSFGSNVPYGRFHDRPHGNRPARRHVGLTEDYMNGATERAADYTVENLKE